MYAFPEMIDFGLKKDQKFPSQDHRVIAENIGIGNPRVTTRDGLVEIVQAVIKVPKDKIRTVTLGELVKDYGCPDVGIWS